MEGYSDRRSDHDHRFAHFSGGGKVDRPASDKLRGSGLSLTSCIKPKGTDLIRQGEDSKYFFLVQSGWVCLNVLLEDGRRRNIGFALPGDAVGITLWPEEEREFGAEASSEVVISQGRNGQLAEIVARSPGLNERLYVHFSTIARDTRNQMIVLASRTAEERVAYLLLTLAMRVLKAFPESGTSIRFPLTQQEMGDALNLTAIHINRMLRMLRDEGAAHLHRGTLTFMNPKLLACLAHLDEGRVLSADDDISMDLRCIA